jgi:UDP-N-acetylmuramyl pentapeptide phosphotransferase/UDP-N-acetylglucosamine-1-phosphate transferase
MMPIAFKIIDKFNIYDSQDERKKHQGKIGFLGGLVIFTSFYLSYGICFPSSLTRPYFSHNLIMSLFAIFILGFADDFLNYNSTKKFIVQFCVSSIFIIKSGLLLNFHEILPFIPASTLLNGILTIVSISLVINSMNLIDGADGVATSLGIIAALIFSIIFVYNKDFYFATLAISLTGSLIGFLYYNKPDAKIYMGDSGSTFIGMLLSIFILHFIKNGSSLINNTNHLNLKISFGLISLPLLDMIRVMITRIFKGNNPFSGDRTHIHHKLQEIGLTKKYVIFFIVAINLLNLSIAYNSQSLINYLAFTFLLYGIMIISINILRSTIMNELNSYSIKRDKLHSEFSKNKEKLHN